MIQEAIHNESFPTGVTEGVISLLFKGGTRNTLNSWRPITLLNTSYKVFAKTLQLRLQPILMEVISPNQSAFLPLRFILDNIFLTNETIAYAKKSNQSLVFLKLDFSKAYDRVDLEFLFLVMERLGFPIEFVKMTKLLFFEVGASVSINGNLTQKFPISQGVRQGCPLAPYLFLIIGEVLNMCIKAEERAGHIRGITLPGTPEPQTLLQYADDSSLTIRGEEQVVNYTVSTLDMFNTVSGLTLNWTKSCAYWWSANRGQRPLWTSRFPWRWVQEEEVTMLLGSPFGISLSTEQIDQFLVERIGKKIDFWATVRLNSAGRAVIANGVMVSTTLYFLSIWAGSTNGVRKVVSKIRNYLFAGTSQPARARVAWRVVCSRKKDGGLNIVNPLEAVTAMMAKWVVSACEPGCSNLKLLIRHRLSSYQPYVQGKWGRSMEWFSLPNHKAAFGSKIWNRVAWAWKTFVPDITKIAPRTYDEWLSTSFWWSPGMENIGPDFSRARAAELFNKGLQHIRHAWCDESARIIPAQVASDRFGLRPNEYAGWERVARRMNVNGGQLLLQSSPRPKDENGSASFLSWRRSLRSWSFRLRKFPTTQYKELFNNFRLMTRRVVTWLWIIPESFSLLLLAKERPEMWMFTTTFLGSRPV
jgi:hypothetical protein